MAVKTFSPKAIEKLQDYNWTGNIRELRNVVERLLILGEKEILEKWEIARVEQVIDILGLQGDSVDNIPGIRSESVV